MESGTEELKNILEKIKEIDAYAKLNLSDKRYQHSIRTAEYAKYLAMLYEDTKNLADIAYLTGLAHDITKELPDTGQVKLAALDGGSIDETEQTRLNLLHGRTAAVILKTEFGITNSSILNAVKYHTFGTPSIDDLGKIIYTADKIEPGRKHAEALRNEAGKCPLNELVIKVIDWNTCYIKSKGCSVHPLTEAMYKKLDE